MSIPKIALFLINHCTEPVRIFEMVFVLHTNEKEQYLMFMSLASAEFELVRSIETYFGVTKKPSRLYPDLKQ